MDKKFYAIQWSENSYSWDYWDIDRGGWYQLTKYPYRASEVKEMLVREGIYKVDPVDIYIVGE